MLTTIQLLIFGSKKGPLIESFLLKFLSIIFLQSTMQKLQLKDLFSALQPQQQQQAQPIQSSTATQNFLAAPSRKVEQLPLKQQLQIKRESTYRNTQQEMDKWVGIVKLNREKQTLNFVKKEKDNAASVGFFPSTPISDFHSKIEGQLKQMEIQSQQVILKKEEAVLATISKQQAQERLKEARKQRTLQFNQEIKRRRIAKIKSKLYHKIKKRQKVREQSKRITGMNTEEKNQHLQKLTKQRIKQRISLRHKSKNKHIQDLLRFSKGNKQTVQDSINEVNNIRRQQLEKANQAIRENLSEEFDEENFREDNIDDLQKQIDEMENEQENEQNQKGLEGMKFMKIGREKEMKQQKNQAKKLLKLLEDPDGMINDDEEQESSEQQEKEITKRKFGEGNQKQQTLQIKNPNFIQKNLRTALGGVEQLTEGINVNRLKEKYQPQRTQLNLNEAIKIHKQAFNPDSQVVQDNYRDFEADKYQAYEAELPAQQKKLKGWGNWAGPGISQPKIDHAAEVKKKLAKIEEIKRKRRDGQMAGVIIRQSYNKQLKDYFVSKLPHNIKSGEQFDYLQNERIGPEWNTLTQFTSNIKPKVLTKAGQVIQAVRMPKHIDKRSK